MTIAESVEALFAKYKWKRIASPRNWDPAEIGEELIGYYGGQTFRNGKWGQYSVGVVHVPQRGAFLVSGTDVIQKLDAALLTPGMPVRIVWYGMKDLPGDKHKKMFDVFVTDGEALPVEALPGLAA